MKECKTCKKLYHHCTGCCIGGLEEDVMWDGYCSIKCWNNSAEYEGNRSLYYSFLYSLSPIQLIRYEKIINEMGKYEYEFEDWIKEFKHQLPPLTRRRVGG